MTYLDKAPKIEWADHGLILQSIQAGTQWPDSVSWDADWAVTGGGISYSSADGGRISRDGVFGGSSYYTHTFTGLAVNTDLTVRITFSKGSGYPDVAGRPTVKIGDTYLGYGLGNITINHTVNTGPAGSVEVSIGCWFLGIQNMDLTNINFSFVDETQPDSDNALLFGYPLLQARGYSEPNEGFKTVKLPSGFEDAWAPDNAFDQVLAGQVMWIPPTDNATAYAGATTGWDGDSGWRKFLEVARKGRQFWFYPDRNDELVRHRCVLVDPMKQEPDKSSVRSRALKLVIRDLDGIPFEGY